MSITTDISFKTKDLGLQKIIASLNTLKKGVVLVGLPGNSPQVQPSAPEPKFKAALPSLVSPSMTVATLGIIHEFGSPANGIPSRPFMRQTWDTHKGGTKALMARIYKQVSSSQLSAPMALARLGVYYEGKIKTTIRNGTFIENKPATIARKRSSKPLIDTGLMRASVTSRVEMGGYSK